MVIDETGIVQAYNPACERLFQYREDEVLGCNVKMLMPAPVSDAHDGYLKRYSQTGEAHILGIGREVSGRRKDGSIFPMYLSVGAGPLHGRRFFVGIVHDLSALYREREAYEARLLTLREELVHVARVGELGQVSAGIAHELNQPLSALLNYANVAKRLAAVGGPEALPKLQEVSAKLVAQVERAGEIVRRIRAFLEKRGAGRSTENIVTIAEDAMALGLIGAKAERIEVRFEHTPGLPSVLADRVQIQQVLVNLLRNAVEAMAEAPKRRLTLKLARDGERAVEFSVSDTGPGIDPAIAASLFQPFITTKAHGMGIGLAISRSIVEAHGGSMSVEENPGGGALFRFTLPVDGERNGAYAGAERSSTQGTSSASTAP